MNEQKSLTILKSTKHLTVDKLYYSPQKPKGGHFKKYTIDGHLEYQNFSHDFGPSNIAHVYRFCVEIENLLQDGHQVCVYSKKLDNQVNSVFLICAYLVVRQNYTPSEATRLLQSEISKFPLYRDASICSQGWKISMLSCLSGLHKAMQLDLFTFRDFNLEEYEKHERVEYGDFNWIIKDKILAFAGPNPERIARNKAQATLFGYDHFSLEDLLDYFVDRNIESVVRLNKKEYDAKIFTQRQIRHFEMYFKDGSNPTFEMCENFIDIVDSTNGAVAVHCKAGLGRTGTLIGAYLMRKYDFTAYEAIGYMRIIRPGMVVGPQQQFLQKFEESLIERPYTLGQSKEAKIPKQPRKQNKAEVFVSQSVDPSVLMY